MICVKNLCSNCSNVVKLPKESLNSVMELPEWLGLDGTTLSDMLVSSS